MASLPIGGAEPARGAIGASSHWAEPAQGGGLGFSGECFRGGGGGSDAAGNPEDDEEEDDTEAGGGGGAVGDSFEGVALNCLVIGLGDITVTGINFLATSSLNVKALKNVELALVVCNIGG